jgi:hypothetical protein
MFPGLTIKLPYSILVSSVGVKVQIMAAAIAQAVSRWLPTAAARVRSRVWSSGICGGQSGAGAGFLRVLRFPLPIFIPPGAGYNRPISGRRAEWTQLNRKAQI